MRRLQSPWVWIPFVSAVLGHGTAVATARGSGLGTDWGLELACIIAIAGVLSAMYGGYRLIRWAARLARP